MQMPKLPALRVNKTWAVLGVALLIGVLAALGARSYLANRMAEIDARSRGNMVEVVVAKRDLKAGERLSADTAAIRPVPADYAHSQSLRPDSFDRASGQVLAYPAKSGEMLLWSLLEPRKAPTFSQRVAVGHRAVTVPVDEISSISGMLEPGDLIDLILTVDRQGKKYSFVMQELVPVLATGQRAVDDPKSGERRNYSTVTFDTTPDEARTIIRAREAGKITALLRNPQDARAVADPEAGKRFLRDIAGDVTQVPVLYGGRSANFAPEALHLAPPGKAAPPPAPPELLTSSRRN